MMDKAAGMQISVGFLDPDLFTSTNISQPLGNSDHLYEVQRGLVSRFC
jgi:hypothetical protein